ncbi:hypothetical protein ACTNES_05805 [Blautia sp. HCP3S3_D9]|uniref:hypothetical protein n=1 Tax=Blautia sp. HCP3S3_D9 TaxID=3438912 RepID=UPI003F89ADAE
MNKKSGLWIALDSVFIIVFNIIFFTMIYDAVSAAIWITYVFIHIAYAMLVITPLLTRKGKHAHLFGTTIAAVSSVYFIAVLIIGIVCIAVRPDTVKWIVIVEIIFLGIYAAILLINMIANEHTADIQEKQDIQIQHIRGCSARLNLLISQVEDKKLRKKIQKAYDVVHSSSIKSKPIAGKYELEVLTLLEAVEEAIETSNVESAEKALDSLIKAAQKRNSLV